MARIPVYQERQAPGRLRQVQQLSAPDSGAVLIGGAMKQVGQALNQVANTTSQVINRQAQTWATETSTNELVYWSDRSEQLKGEVGTGGAGYFKALNQEFEQRANKIIAEAPNDQSRRYLSQNFLNLRKSLLQNAIQFEVVEGRAAELNGFTESANNIAIAAAKTKDPELIRMEIGQMEAQIDASTLLPRQKEEKKREMRQVIATSYASSIVRDTPAAAVEILSKEPPKVTDATNRKKLFAAQQTVESANNPKAVSSAGAIGLMQVLPSTAMDPGFDLPNIFEFAKAKGMPFRDRSEATAKMLLQDEKIGAEYGQAYMDAMLKRYDDNPVYALAAYNWGPGRTDDWVARGANMDELPKETRDYIPKVLNKAGLTGEAAGEPQDSLFGMLPLGEQLKLLDIAKSNQSAQIIESTVGSLWSELGPQSDTDAVEMDVLNNNIDYIMADRTADERKAARTLMASYAQAHNASSKQRSAERVSGVWTNVLNGAPMSEIIGSPEWKALDGTQKAQLIGQINSFRTQSTSPAQWAAYSEITADPAALASMSRDEVLSLAPQLGNELTTQLVKDRAKLNTAEGLSAAKYDDDTFKIFASKAGLKVFDTKAGTEEKQKIGQFKYAVENALGVRQEQLKRPLTRAETEDVMAEVLSNKVYIDEWGSDPEVVLALVSEDDMGDTYVKVGTQEVYLRDIPASDRAMITRQLRAAAQPVTEAAIAEVWLAAKQPSE